MPENIVFHFPSNSSICPFTWEASFPEISKPLEFVYHLAVWKHLLERPPGWVWNLCFAAKGEIFILFFAFSVLIFLTSAYATYFCFSRPAAGTTHRKALFLCLLGASVVRLVYSSISLKKVLAVKTMEDVSVVGEFFVKTLVPVMSLSDWFTGLVDVAMAFFWYSIQANLPSFPSTWFALCMLGSGKILAMICAYDTDFVLNNLNSNPDHFYDALLWYIAVIVLIGAVSHIVVAVAVIRIALRTSSSVVWWTRFKNLWPMFVIVFVTAGSGIIRAGVLVGRQTGIPLFYSGIMSFNNPTFTTTYFILIMQIPPLVVALIAASMTIKSAKTAAMQQEEAANLVLDRGSQYGTDAVTNDNDGTIRGDDHSGGARSCVADETDDM